MRYDFETVKDRSACGSMKWRELARVPHAAEDAIPFSVADMEFPLAPEIAEGLAQFLRDNVLGYAAPPERYLSAVVNWMARRHQWTILPEMIKGSAGVINALHLSVRAFTQPGDGVLLLTPVYYPMYGAIRKNDRVVVECPLVEREGRYEIDFDDLAAKAHRSRTKLLLLCSPHNPGGRVWSRQELAQIGEICVENQVVVVADEIHHDLIMPGHQHTVFAAVNETCAQNCVVCTAPSKTFNLAGLQTSNIVIPNEVLRERYVEEAVRSGSGVRCNILGMEACRIAYTQCEPWLEEVIALIDTNRRLVTQFLKAQLPAVKTMPLEGTYLLWMDFRALGVESRLLAERLKRDASLFFDDGYIFGENGAGFERWNLACPTRYIEAALPRLKAALKDGGGAAGE